MKTNEWFRFVMAALAVWRLAHLLASEDGPWDLIVRIRRMLGTTPWGKLMDCFYCLSVWISIPFALYVADGVLDRLVAWLALSGAASLANKFIANKLMKEPIVFEALDTRDS